MTCETCTLAYITNGKNENGFPVEIKRETEVYCREKSVTRTEFYDAHREGFTISLVLEVRQEDWELTKHTVNGKRAYATKVAFDGGEYDIVRTYRNDKSMIQLMCG
jgi:hypothetical protein